MKKIIISFALLLCCSVCVYAQKVKFEGNTHAVYQVEPEKSTGLNSIYVLYSTSGVAMAYESVNASNTVKWYKYGSMGGGYAEEILGIAKNGAVTTLSQLIPNSGYIIEDGDNRTYLWVVNYADYYLNLTSINPASQQDCGSIALEVAGSGNDINYTTINGVGKKLSRDITLTFNTLEWDSDNNQWQQKEEELIYEGFKPSIYEQAPLCNTVFTLSGDKFLKFWGEDVAVTSGTYVASSVDVRTVAEQTERDVPNEKTESDATTLGGSAPVEITFTAYPTDAVATKEWQLATDPEFETIDNTVADDVLQETFNDMGTFYVRYVGRNADGTCEAISETYTVTVGESSLICPNAFSPQSTPGVNDEWRVQYKSIVSFKCWIFNRWGVQLCELNDPSQGWDGKYKGKYVGAGVYYYVIQARGADGKEYKLKGDINIINYKGTTTTGNGEGVVTE